MIKVLYVNHRQQQCGVYEFGKGIGKALLNSKKFTVRYCECDSFRELKKEYNVFHPDIIIYNFHPSTMKWVLPENKFDAPVTYKLPAIHIGTIHEVHQQLADETRDDVFDFHIAPDPTLLLKNPIVFKTGRLLPRKPLARMQNGKIPVIGSFGFATSGKGFDKIINLVQNEFDEAIIRLNIPFAKFGDETGELAKRIAVQCNELLVKKSIQLQVDHDYLADEDLLEFLSSNTINVFLYDDMPARGISSATDWALASGRPLAISKSRLFRHLFSCRPGICIEQNNLRQIMDNGTAPLHRIWEDWSEETILWEYERIINLSLQKPSKSGRGNRNRIRYFARKTLKKLGYLKEPTIALNPWTKKGDEFNVPPGLYNDYEPVNLPEGMSLNRILDDEARKLYRPAIEYFKQNLAELLAKKIPEANVQQAFVFDTAVRFYKGMARPKLLAVGSFEDTAAEGLKLMGTDLDSIDPILNYDLHTFLSKPGVTGGSYDIILSTSVIEHVEDDVRFLKDMAYLLKRGGYAILTCDYNDQYRPGDEIPGSDFRFYTQADIKDRLMAEIPDCRLVDMPQWDCIRPDFTLVEKYNYTFAAIVFEKL